KHNIDSIVVIDEAYIDFGGESAKELLKKYDNLLIIQTFSKFRSLAGIRLGVALGNREIISKLYDVKNSFNSYPIDSLAQVIGKASIEDSDYIKENAQKIINTREYTKKELKKLGFVMTDSYSNFIFVKHPDYDANVLFQQLRENKILVRHFSKDRIDQYLRITIGTKQQMETLVETLKKIL
ncbi:MAG: aminotransferase class I/II-fold pyridoxal phosphate-dependent enzyme, partial [Erysipelotrichaceae bacterium]|nr:aminotransferase class I/II-fold pyridoxal phosphate-dependent enzyme [Erysipelotrichaceae bacterium]